MIKVKLSQLKSIIESLNKLIQKEISISLSWKISDLYDEFMNQYEKYIKQLSKLLNEYAERDKDGKPIQEDDGIKIQKDKADEFTEKMNELNNIEIEINKSSILLEDLIAENIKISPMDLYILKDLISK